MRRSRTRSYRLLVGLMCVAASGAYVSGVQAQQAQTQGGTLDDRLPASVRGAVVALADSAAKAGLPRAPLIDKALEGVSKKADDRRILAAVRIVADNLGIARRALGAKAEAGEITAGAAALRAGVPSATLAQVRKSLPGRTLTVPLSVLSALVVQGVAAPAATDVVVAQAKRDNDERLLVLGKDAVRRLAAGVPPKLVVASFSSFGRNGTSLGPALVPSPAPLDMSDPLMVTGTSSKVPAKSKP